MQVSWEIVIKEAASHYCYNVASFSCFWFYRRYSQTYSAFEMEIVSICWTKLKSAAYVTQTLQVRLFSCYSPAYNKE